MIINRRRKKMTLKAGQLAGMLHIGLLCLLLVLKVLRAYSGEEGSGGIWNLIQLFFIASGLYMTVRYARYHRQQPAIAVFIAFGLVTVLIGAAKLRTFTVYQLFNVITLPYAPMMLVWVYYLAKKGKLTPLYKYVYWTYYVIAVIVLMAMIRYSLGEVSDKGAVADVYYVVALMPFALYYVRKWDDGLWVPGRKKKLLLQQRQGIAPVDYRADWRILLPIVAPAAGTIMTGKRAGLLAVAAMVLVYFFFVYRQQKSSKRQIRLLMMFAGIILLAVLVMQILIERYNLNIIDRLMTLAEDGGSGRDVIWQERINALLQASPMELLFGLPAGTFTKNAHNDFLELMVLYGIFPVILYGMYFVLLLCQMRRMIRNRYPYVAEFATAIVSAGFLAMFSFFVIDPTYITSHVFSAGVLMADYQHFLKERKVQR